MSADIIDLDEYRKRKQSENAGKRLRGRGFPDDIMVGPDEPLEDFDPTAWLARFFKEDNGGDNDL